MAPTVRRIAIVAAAVLTTALAACSNPMAPAAAKKTPAPAQAPHLDGVYMGSFG